MWSNKREFCRNSGIFPHSNKSVKRLILNLLASKLQNQFVSYKGNLLESAQSFLRKQERNMTPQSSETPGVNCSFSYCYGVDTPIANAFLL